MSSEHGPKKKPSKAIPPPVVNKTGSAMEYWWQLQKLTPGGNWANCMGNALDSGGQVDQELVQPGATYDGGVYRIVLLSAPLFENPGPEL